MEKIHNFNIVFDSQKMFRLILEAMANPFKEVNISELCDKFFEGDKSFLAIALTLLDNESSFYTFKKKELDEKIISLTLSREESCSEADIIYVDREENLNSAIFQGKIGSLENPHRSTMVIVKVPYEKKCTMKVQGPGIKGVKEVRVNSIVESAISKRDSMEYEYPQGIDFLFLNENENLFAVPRLVKRGEN